MTRTSIPLALAVVLGCHMDESGAAWSKDGTGGVQESEGGDVGPQSSVDAESSTDAGTDAHASEDGTAEAGTPGEESSSESGGVPIDCSPAWSGAWIGSPCTSDGDCTYDGGFCLRDDQGFPCGTCSQACTSLCPDQDGAPETFCIDGADVGLAGSGHCVSQCDNTLSGAEGCRDGYACDVLARSDGTDVADVCIPAAFDSAQDYVDEIDHEFLIAHFGGDPTVSAFDFADDLDGFQLYLDAVGIQHVTAADLAEPYNEAVAAMCGLELLLPEQDAWEKGAALALFTDVLTELVGEPIFLRNWWRPPCYNEGVGGEAGGDHPDGDAVDLDFASPASRGIAQGFLCETYWNMDIVTPEQIMPGSDLDPRLNLSVGLGGVTIHLGVLSANGRRFWYYDSYSSEPEGGDCW